jgi:hypothetical protein
MVPAERKATAPILLPPYGPEREVEAVPYSAEQYWLQRHSSISPVSSVFGAQPMPLGKRSSSQYPVQFLAQLGTAIAKQKARHSESSLAE